jgi:hypothetical protein
MKVGAGMLAATLVVVYNVAAIAPAAQERRAPVGRVTIAVCGEHIVGGWRDGELPMLSLPLATPQAGWGDVIDVPTLRSLGFAEKSIAALHDTTWRDGAWPAPRRAWLTLAQQADSGRRYDVVAANATRPTAAAGQLVVQGLVTLERIWQAPDSAAPTAPRGWELGVGVMRLLPSQLGLDRAQAEALRSLRQNSSWGCTATATATLAFGSRGSVWVESVSAPR